MRRLLVAAVAAATLALVGACGGASGAAAGDGGTAAASAAPFNGTDVMFLQMMLAHHGQTLELVRLAADRAADAEVKTLAAAINATQSAEVETMTGWLRTWGEPTAGPADAAAHAHHGGMPATGPDEIAALRGTRGAEFDRALLNLLVGHQHGAVEMARWEVQGGAHPEVVEFARRVDQSRTAQISLMLRLVA